MVVGYSMHQGEAQSPPSVQKGEIRMAIYHHSSYAFPCLCSKADSENTKEESDRTKRKAIDPRAREIIYCRWL